MSSVGEILDIVQQAQSANSEYLGLQAPVAEQLEIISVRQTALAQLIGEYVADLAALQDAIDGCIDHHSTAASKLGDASFNLEVVSMGADSPNLQIAAAAVLTVSSETSGFGGQLVTMSTTLAGQQRQFAELEAQLNTIAAETTGMAEHAKGHVAQITAAGNTLSLYASSLGGEG